jgi:hypothetical protein
VRIDGVGAAVQLLDVRMIVGADSTRAMTRRWSVMRMPFSIQSFSSRSKAAPPSESMAR